MQFALGIPPNLRTNIDYVFILRENIVSNRKRIYEHYAGMFPSFEMFCQIMDQCTENYECLVIKIAQIYHGHFLLIINFLIEYLFDFLI